MKPIEMAFFTLIDQSFPSPRAYVFGRSINRCFVSPVALAGCRPNAGMGMSTFRDALTRIARIPPSESAFDTLN